MPRPKSLVPTTRLELKLPLDLRATLDLALVSELEGRVPLGHYSAFFEQRLREHFAWQTLDLHPFGFPPGSFVRGPESMIEGLRAHLLINSPHSKEPPT